MTHIIKKELLTSLWAIEENKPYPPYFLSYCDAQLQYEEWNAKAQKENDNEWSEYHSVNQIAVVEPIPTEGCMWFAKGQHFSSKGDALDVSDNPEFVEVTVI